MPQISTEGVGTARSRAIATLTRWTPFAALAILFVVVARFKAEAEWAMPPHLFKEESALQYRYARMVARGEPIPILDRAFQYPEGVRPREDLPLLMERLTGFAARAWRIVRPAAEFGDVIVVVKAIVSTVSLPACFAVAWLVFRSRWAGLWGAFLDACSQAATYRTVQGFAHEDFALPLLFLGVAGMIAGLVHPVARVRAGCSLAAGGALAGALLTWHFSRFVLLAEAAAMACVLAAGNVATARRIRVTLGATVAVLAVAAVSTTHLRATRLIGGGPFLALVAVLAAASVVSAGGPPRRFAAGRVRKFAWYFGLPIAGLLIAVATDPNRALYGHVWELLLAKVRHGGIKPTDPSSLPFDVRVLWTGSFHGASPAWVLWAMGGPLLASAWALGRAASGRLDLSDAPRRSGWLLLAVNAVGFTVAVFLARRLSVFAVFFLAALGGGSIARGPGGVGRMAAAGLLAAVLLANSPWLHGPAWVRLPPPVTASSPAEQFQPVSQVDVSLTAWARLETPRDAVFAGRFNVLPPLLAYADRAIALHSKFEVPGIRDKVRRHLRAVFGSEDDLAAFCDANGVTLYLYDPFTSLDVGVDGARYAAGVTALRKDCAAYLLHFEPARLRRFELTYQNSLYRVYRRTDRPSVVSAGRFPNAPLFDIDRFAPTSPTEDPFFSDAATDRVLTEQQQANDMLRRAVSSFVRGRWPEALASYDEALRINPSLPYAHSHRARILLRDRRFAEALDAALRAVAVDPYEPEGFYHLAMVRASLGDRPAARESLARCRKLEPNFPGLAEAARRLR